MTDGLIRILCIDFFCMYYFILFQFFSELHLCSRYGVITVSYSFIICIIFLHNFLLRNTPSISISLEKSNESSKNEREYVRKIRILMEIEAQKNQGTPKISSEISEDIFGVPILHYITHLILWALINIRHYSNISELIETLSLSFEYWDLMENKATDITGSLKHTNGSERSKPSHLISISTKHSLSHIV